MAEERSGGASAAKEEGFLEKVKDFIQDIGEKIEETLGFGKPTASIAGFHLPCITLERADIVVDVLIANPNPIPIPLVDIEYSIDSDGRKLVEGIIPDAGTIRAHGSETVKIPISLVYDDIKNTYDDIKPGAVIPYYAKVVLVADVPILGKLRVPVDKRGEIPIPYKPDVDVDNVEWDRLSMEETLAIVHIKIENKNKFDLGIRELEYDLKLAGIPVSKAKLSKSVDIAKDGIGYVEVPISFRPKDFGSALWDIIRGRGTGYSLVGKLEVASPFGPMHLPFKKESETSLQKKEGAEDVEDDEDDEKKKEKHHHWFSLRECSEVHEEKSGAAAAAAAEDE